MRFLESRYPPFAKEPTHARQETGWTSLGSDEVAVTALAVPVFNWSDATLGEKQTFGLDPERRFEDMNTGNPRARWARSSCRTFR
jgi:hypothetical protein